MKIGVLALMGPLAFAQTVLDGVYTAAQARRGETAYQMNCAGCHGETLDGRAMGPLRGDKFLDRWREDNLAPLFDHIRTRMPANAAGSLSSATYLDILAYILQVNAYPPGPQELTQDSVAKFKLVGKDGPKSLGSNTLVAVIGCFRRSKDDWIVGSATEPVRTRNADEITAEERNRAALATLAAQEFQMGNLDELSGVKPETLLNHRVEVKGVLLRRPGRDRINVLAVDSIAESCQ
ncbi:MAG TPA: cytochrome c [Bryobacteraceae bacterium]|nr:cytochrome c [Bryobacteraceae bacterium]